MTLPLVKIQFYWKTETLICHTPPSALYEQNTGYLKNIWHVQGAQGAQGALS